MAQIPGADPEVVPLWQQLAAAAGIFGGAAIAAAVRYVRSLGGEKKASNETNQIVLETAQLADLRALSTPLIDLLGETRAMRRELVDELKLVREMMEEQEESKEFDDRFALALRRLELAERAQGGGTVGQSSRAFDSREQEMDYHRTRRERRRGPRRGGGNEGA